MRCAPLRFEARPRAIAEVERGAVVDGWLAGRELALALELKLLGCFVTRIQPAQALQHRGRGIIGVQPVRLMDLAVAVEPEPMEISLDRGGVLRG